MLPFLDDVLAQGSAVMRRAAFEQMARLDPRRAERAVRDALRTPAARPARERRERLRWFLLIGTAPAAQLFLEEGGAIVGGPVESFDLLLDHVARSVPSLEAPAVHRLLAQLGLAPPLPHAPWVEGRPEARALARALLDHDDPAAQERGAWLLCEVDRREALPVLRELGRTPPLALVLPLSRGVRPAVQFDDLSGYVATEAGRKEVVAALGLPLDPRWMPLLEPHLDESLVTEVLGIDGHPGALARLRADAARPVFDAVTRRACDCLGKAGDREATPLLLRWLAEPGLRHEAYLLLTALGGCAGPGVIPVIEQLAAREPERANLCAGVVASIRRRGA